MRHLWRQKVKEDASGVRGALPVALDDDDVALSVARDGGPVTDVYEHAVGVCDVRLGLGVEAADKDLSCALGRRGARS